MKNYSPFFWGRGNGWAAASMTELLQVLPTNHPRYTTIMSGYRNQMNALIKAQGPDGMWKQLLDDTTFWNETSCTGMFIFALATGVERGWLVGDQYKNAIKKGWMKLITYVDSQGRLTEVCRGTNAGRGETPYSYELTKKYYYDRPRPEGDNHGTAGFIWAATAVVRLLSKPQTAISPEPRLSPVSQMHKTSTDTRVFDIQGRFVGGSGLTAGNTMTNGVYIIGGKRHVVMPR